MTAQPVIPPTAAVTAAATADAACPRPAEGRWRWRWPLLQLLPLLMWAALFSGCASLAPVPADRPVEQALPAAADQGLGLQASQGLAQAQPAGPSALMSLAHPSLALDARLTLIAQARHSIELQTFHLADDEVGRGVLRALRDAAARGVRVRLLLDDFHTHGTDGLLAVLDEQPGAEVRLYNPIPAGSRASAPGRLLALAGDFSRLNHRMHNKLFIVDGAFAIVGGRNVAAGYFQRSPEANFIDFDALAVGAVVPELAAVFDQYWNSPVVHELRRVLPNLTPEVQQRRRHDFDRLTTPALATLQAGMAVVGSGAGVVRPPAFATLLRDGLPGLHGAVVKVIADAPDKLHQALDDEVTGTATHRVVREFYQSREELMLFSPYFVPGAMGMAGLRAARAGGVAVRVITNTLGASDEPLAALAYEGYREPLLKLGVELYEVSAMQVRRDERQNALFGPSRAQLHAKLASIDRRTLLLGSLNLDPRSAAINTELALVVHSPALTQEVLAWFNSRERRDVRGSYQVRLRPDGQGLQWVALLGEGRTEVYDQEPEAQAWRRLRLWLMSLLVPESML